MSHGQYYISYSGGPKLNPDHYYDMEYYNPDHYNMEHYNPECSAL